MTITIRPRLLLAISKWAYQHDDRLHLRMVRFGDGEMVATDGHRIVIAPIDTGGATFGIRPKEIAAIAAAHREAGNKYGDITIEVDDKLLRVAIGDRITLTSPAHDASGYPPYRQVVPEKRETAAPQAYEFNPGYLAAIEEVMREHPGGRSEGNGVKCTAWSEIGSDGIVGPMVFEGLGMKFVIMPMRGERTD